jgi:hypothetical protein
MKFLERRRVNAEFLRAEFAKIFDSHHRIFCASKTKESILMWSYYAEEHKGVVLGFDFEKKPFKELKDWIVTINYQEPKSQFAYNPNDNKWHESLLRVVGTKYKDWKHEEEVRAIFPGDEEIVKIPETTICNVIFGCRCPASERTEITNILNAPRYSHVQISEAHMCRDHFALEFRTLSIGKYYGAPNPP